jgi:hypothetical protein
MDAASIEKAPNKARRTALRHTLQQTTRSQPDYTWTLYHVSLPGLSMDKVDEGIQSTGSYQWLRGGE